MPRGIARAYVIRLLTIMACVAAFVAGGQARALLVTYDLNSNQGPIELRFEADDASADTRLRFRNNQADISSLLDITLVVGGTSYTLIGALDSDEGLLDRQARTISYVVAEVTRPFANTLTTVNLTFSARMNRIRDIGDLFAYLDSARIISGNLQINPAAAPVPLPGAAILFATGVMAFRAKGLLAR